MPSELFFVEGAVFVGWMLFAIGALGLGFMVGISVAALFLAGSVELLRHALRLLGFRK